MIQERFDELQPYLTGIKIAEDFTIVESILKDTWKVKQLLPADTQIETNASESPGYKYFMFYSEEKTIDQLVNLLESIVDFNIEMEEKQSLLRSKVDELKRVFEDKSLEELKSLRFDMLDNFNIPISTEKESIPPPNPPEDRSITEGEELKKPKNHGITEKV